jgi:hypothetical protein
MEVQPDFRDLFALFNAHSVDYLIVGAYALAYHGAPRYTGDLDILVRPDQENASRIVAALSDFGFGESGLSIDDFSIPGKVVQLGVPPVRIDLMTSLTGLSWSDASKDRESGTYGDVPVTYIGRDPLIRNKRATGRRKDLADLEAMGEE